MTDPRDDALRAAEEALQVTRDYVFDASTGALTYRGRAELTATSGEDLVLVDEALATAKAALSFPPVDPAAIRRAALEEAAQVAAGTQSYDDALQSIHTGATTGQHIAAAIRALADREPRP